MVKSIEIRLTETWMSQQLAERQVDFSPFELTSIQSAPKGDYKPDSLIHLLWSGKTFHFAVENKVRFDSLQLVKNAIEQVHQYAKRTDCHPMIYLP